MIDLFKVFMSSEAKIKVAEVLDSGFIGQGETVKEFEKALRNYFEVPHAITVNSATSAEHLALHLLKRYGLNPGDEVLATPLTCSASNWPIIHNGFKIKWVDINPDNLNIDMNDLERKITPSTKAIMGVHWSGIPLDMDRIDQIRQKAYDTYGFRPHVIYDCAHAMGSRYRGKLVGSRGINTFSFQAIKHLTTGDGGCITTNWDELAEQAILDRWYGISRDDSKRSDFRCLDGRSLVKLDGKKIPIRQIVEKKLQGEVEVFNLESNRLELTRIKNWIESPRNGRKIYTVTTKSLRNRYKSYLTNDHKVLTEKRGWQKVEDLHLEEKILTPFPCPNFNQMALLTGSLLGDMCLTTKKIKGESLLSMFSEVHSEKQESYLRLKFEALRSMDCNVIKVPANIDKKRPNDHFQLYSKSNPFLNELRKIWYPEGEKIVPRDFIKEHFTPFSLAAWYMDDGSLSKGIAEIATNGFKKEDVEWLISYLNSMKLPCYLYEGKKSGLKNYGCRIFFTNKGTENLCEMIKEFVPPSLQYKLLDEYKGFFNESLWSNSTALPFYDESKVEWAPDNKTTSGGNTVYCLEVESPHSNFAANAVIVHNCEEDIKSVGFKFHMNNINAAIGLANIKHIDSIVGQHKANAKYYDLMLAGMSGVKLLKRDERDDPAFWIYSILVENKPDFMRAMKDRGIMTSQVHERNDKHSCVKEFKTFLPNLDKIIPQLVHIPVGWWLGRKECDQVIDAMAKGW